jgi:hypothetical protein
MTHTMRSDRKVRRFVGTVLGAAVVVGISALAPSASAQVEPALTLSPTTVMPGETFTLTATGCVVEGVPQEELAVVWIYEFDLLGGVLPTDAEGTATATGTADASHAPELRIGASCVRTTVEGPEAIVFRYETQFLAVVVPTTTTSTSTSPTTSGTAPAAVVAAPAFTG